MYRRIHVVVNPAAGKPEPILNTLHQAFHPAGIRWTVSVTMGPGDATDQTRQALEDGADLVVAYGGDGTVMEIVNGLVGSEVPLGLLPGGTGNLVSLELNIPQDLASAAALLVSPDSELRRVDIGDCDGRHFMLRLAIGWTVQQIQTTDRGLRDRFGKLAYFIAGLRALPASEVIQYAFTIDGERVEAEGFTCLIENAGNIGVSGLTLAPDVNMGDGALDLFVARALNLKTISSVAASIANLQFDEEQLGHWRGREFHVETDPLQPVTVDGEPAGETPITVRVWPEAIQVVVPPTPQPLPQP